MGRPRLGTTSHAATGHFYSIEKAACGDLWSYTPPKDDAPRAAQANSAHPAQLLGPPESSDYPKQTRAVSRELVGILRATPRGFWCRRGELQSLDHVARELLTRPPATVVFAANDKHSSAPTTHTWVAFGAKRRHMPVTNAGPRNAI